MTANSVSIGPLDYPAYVENLRAVAPEVARDIEAFTGIGQVLDWMQRKELDLKAIDFVSQDEFEYDFLLGLETSGRWLAFGVT